MATICYAWNETPFAWIDTPFTWAEGCVIEKVIGGGGGAISSQTIRKRLNDLPEDDKEVLIGLFLRLNVDEIEFERTVNKNKNTKVKIKLSDIDVKPSIEKIVKVNIKINED